MYNWRNGGDIREGLLVLIYAVAARCLVITGRKAPRHRVRGYIWPM